MKYLALILALLPAMSTAMSMTPDETRPLNAVPITYTAPFERENGTLMTAEEYGNLLITIDGQQYKLFNSIPAWKPVSTEPAVIYIYSFNPTGTVEIRLQDTDGRQSTPTAWTYDFTPSAPRGVTCK